MYKKLNKQRGSVGFEFVLTMPLFLLIVFVVLEISFCWVDRYLLRLGTFEAARVVTLIDDFSACTEESCECSEEALKKAEYRLALRLANSAAELNAKVTKKILGDQGGGSEPLSQSSPRLAQMASFGRFVAGIPTAALLSQITQCQFVPRENAVRMQTRYHRPVKVPLGGRFLAGSMASLMEIQGKTKNQQVLGVTKEISDVLIEYRSSFITLHMATRLKIPEYLNHQESQWKKGSAFAVAPFFDKKYAENWRNWALKMQELPVE